MKSSKLALVLFAAALAGGIGSHFLHDVVGSAPAIRSAQAAPPESGNFVALSKKIVPSVVNISTLSTVKSPYGQGGPDDLFRRFFEDFFRRHGQGGPPGGGGEEEEEEAPPRPGPPGKGPKAMSLGTGFIIEPGLILTNNHVVAEADEIKIHFTEETDEKPTDGEVVGRDQELDVALIRVKSKREMIPVALGDSEAVEVGEYVIAVGNPFGQGHSVTHGIISAKGRIAPDFPLANYLQTDAPINPGN
ncbi:MAG TPA: trypsin-like peptidase domain-containing protein, partial [Bdellovibrionota bacterium]|nr:trypsin-like peptidase domain-containing protein [Bdellovibrionota bacterium]